MRSSELDRHDDDADVGRLCDAIAAAEADVMRIDGRKTLFGAPFDDASNGGFLFIYFSLFFVCLVIVVLLYFIFILLLLLIVR